GSRIKCPAILVKRNKQRVFIIPKNILGPVTMMAISVDDGHSHSPEFLPQMLHHHRLDIDDAKSPVPVRDPEGMVTGRTHEGKRFVNLPFHYCFTGTYRSAG